MQKSKGRRVQQAARVVKRTRRSAAQTEAPTRQPSTGASTAAPTTSKRPKFGAATLLALNVRNLLHERRISQTELAKRMGRSQPYLSQILNGRRGIQLGALDDLAHRLDVPVSELLSDPTAAPARHMTGEEALFLDGLRRADAETVQGIRHVLHLPAVTEHQQDADSPAPGGQLLSGDGSSQPLASIVATILEAAARDPAVLSRLQQGRTSRPGIRASGE